jgi:hypothetical protein
MTLDPRHLLARVISFMLHGIGVLHPLGVHDTAASLLFPTMALSGRANQLFLKLVPEGKLRLGQISRSIDGNTYSKCASSENQRCGAWFPDAQTPGSGE